VCVHLLQYYAGFALALYTHQESDYVYPMVIQSMFALVEFIQVCVSV
jgi:hypothetical protein